jgi:exopolysaccharide biosynthesis polyprenyl glycosylphosphotransferase
VTTDQGTSRAASSRPVVDLPDFVRPRTAAPRTDPLAGYRRTVVLGDLVMIVLATSIGYLTRFGLPDTLDGAVAPHRALGIGLVVLWPIALYARGCYDTRFIGVGPDEFNRILMGTVLLFAVLAGISYLMKSEVSRVYVFISLPIGVVLVMAERWTLRRLLYRDRAAGRACYRTVVLGSPARIEELTAELTKDAYAGYLVVGSAAPPAAGLAALDAWLLSVDELLRGTQADAVAVTPSAHLDTEVVRRLSWQIEGRGIDLLVAPALGDVAGPRVSMRPAAGVPLIHLEEPGLSSAQRIAKRTLDIVGAIGGLVLLSPLLLVIALLVRAGSPGPVLFRQWRVGKNGATFPILKFRTMRADADGEREHLRRAAGGASPAFKLPADPRVTRAGRVLRRWSLDELPQLVNVLRGDMSLVGPRPHPIDDVSRYGHHDFRRLLAKPGMTGLWQVEGRSTLDWTESVQLDLYYIENWSLSGDLVLLVRTFRAVLDGRGAT